MVNNVHFSFLGHLSLTGRLPLGWYTHNKNAHVIRSFLRWARHDQVVCQKCGISRRTIRSAPRFCKPTTTTTNNTIRALYSEYTLKHRLAFVACALCLTTIISLPNVLDTTAQTTTMHHPPPHPPQPPPQPPPPQPPPPPKQPPSPLSLPPLECWCWWCPEEVGYAP